MQYNESISLGYMGPDRCHLCHPQGGDGVAK